MMANGGEEMNDVPVIGWMRVATSTAAAHVPGATEERWGSSTSVPNCMRLSLAAHDAAHHFVPEG